MRERRLLRDEPLEDEERLVKLAKQRDSESFGKLYDRHFDRIYRYLYFKTGSPEVAQDLTQEVFLKAWDAIDSYKLKGMPFSAWLFRIAHNQLVDHLRKKTRRKETALEETVAASDANPAALIEDSITIEELAAACARLPEDQQEILSLRFAGGMSTAEVAQAVGKTEGAVKAIQHKALVALRRTMSQE
jgi:RNA polymerase sigma-70 factor (ECF subfamily)